MPGRDVGILCEGDPLFYGSYIYLHERLAPRYRTEVVPGVTSFSAAAASAGIPLARRDEVLSILPGTLPAEALAARLSTTDAAVVIKLGRNFAKVRDAARRAEVAGRAIYVERASSDEEQHGRARRRERGIRPVHVARARAGRAGRGARRCRRARGRRARPRRARSG